MQDILFFLWGMVTLAILQRLVRKEVEVAAKHDVAWSARFTHNEKAIFIQGKDLGMGAESFVRGPLKNLSPNYGEAEWNLIAQTLVKFVQDGKTMWKTGDDARKLPSEYDRETKKTTGQVVLCYLITKIYPHLAEMYPAAFEEYDDEEFVAELLGETPTTSPEDPPNPTAPTLVDPFGSEE